MMSSPVSQTHGLVVREHTQRVRRLAAVGVDVVDVGRVAGALERGDVLVGVAGAGRAVGVGRRDAGDVLGGEHQHVTADLVGDRVGERSPVDGLRPLRAVNQTCTLSLARAAVTVPRSSAKYLSHVVAVALAAPPLARPLGALARRR